MPDIFGYLLLILIGGPVVFAMAGACAVRWLGHNSGDVFADWYVTRELLVRCLPWVEPENPFAWLGEFPRLHEWIGSYGLFQDLKTRTVGPILTYREGIGVTNLRQGWLPSGDEVQP